MVAFREIKHPGDQGPSNPVEFDPPTNRSLTLTRAADSPSTLTGPFVYNSEEGSQWSGTFKLEDGKKTTRVSLTFETGGVMKDGENSTGKTFNTAVWIDTNGSWFQTIEDRLPAEQYRHRVEQRVAISIESVYTALRRCVAAQAILRTFQCDSLKHNRLCCVSRWSFHDCDG